MIRFEETIIKVRYSCPIDRIDVISYSACDSHFPICIFISQDRLREKGTKLSEWQPSEKGTSVQAIPRSSLAIKVAWNYMGNSSGRRMELKHLVGISLLLGYALTRN